MPHIFVWVSRFLVLVSNMKSDEHTKVETLFNSDTLDFGGPHECTIISEHSDLLSRLKENYFLK